MRHDPFTRRCLRRGTSSAINFLLLTAAVTTLAFQQRPEPSFPEWTPPASRTKEKTPFAPRPAGGDNIFEGEAERWLSEAVADDDSIRVLEDEDVSLYVSRVGQNLVAHSSAPKKSYEFVVTRDEDVNAWTAGGGRVYVNLGMLRAVETEDELAGVLAHEIGHDAFGHAARTVTRQLFWMTGVRKVKSPEDVRNALKGLFDEYEEKPLAAIGENLLGFSRFDELEADRAAFYNVYRAGYNPRALAAVLRRMERDAREETDEDEYASAQFLALLFGSHPPTSQRGVAFSWESNFVKMPPKGARRSSPAFDAMKAKVSKMKPWWEETQKKK